ncbi:hypothetical protein JW905_18950 [bacterium]|nr:hypothetical protein [candidate division CSSED10-310 bacterium]
MTQCHNMEQNAQYCNCTYEPCNKKLKCCECLHYHRRMGELPACFFSVKSERTYDRSIARFVRENSR